MDAQEKVLKAIIEGYRNTIAQRYQYDKIKSNYDIPESINETKVTQLRTYFLNYIYPPYEEREVLNNAFKSLDIYTKQPQKLVRIAVDAAKLVFKYGRHLPKILSAGLQAMTTFKAATTFEKNLIEAASKNNKQPPFQENDIDQLIALLSRDAIEDFIESSQALFELLHDRVLIKKIKEVISYLILAMKKNTSTYSHNQIKGLELGLELIVEGDKLFTSLSKNEQQLLLDTIIKIERDHLDRLF